MTILSLGFILLAGLLLGKFIRKLKVPVVTAYLILGIFIGPSCVNLVSENILRSSGLISNIVLGLIAFSIGQNFAVERFKKIGNPVMWISVLAAVIPWVSVTLGLMAFTTQPFFICLLFGAISSATAPAATMMIVRDYKAKGTFTDTLLGVVAIDDAWCLIIFALSLAVAKSFALPGGALNGVILESIGHALFEIFGAFLLGGILAIILSYLARFISTSTDLLIYTLGFIFLATGLALYFNFSLLLTNMFLAAVLVNVHKVSFKFFDALRTIDSPLYLLFFVLAGANLEFHLLGSLGALGLGYIFLRFFGKILGAYIGGVIAQVPPRMKKYMGLALLPQAGVALGVALIAKTEFPEIGNIIFTTIVATTVVYEIFGPLGTKIGLQKAGEI